MSSGHLQNQTFDNKDPLLKYQGGWFLDGTWNAPSGGQSATFSSTSDPTATVTFVNPSQFLSKVLVNFDAHTKSSEDVSSQTFHPPAVHEIIIRNENDTRVEPSGFSQLIVNRFVLQIPIPVVPGPSQLTLPPLPSSTLASTSRSATSTSTSGSLNVTTLQPGPVAVTGSSLDQTPKTTAPVNAITLPTPFGPNSGHNPSTANTSTNNKPSTVVGGVVGGLAFLLLLISLIYRYTRTRSKKGSGDINITTVHQFEDARLARYSYAVPPRKALGYLIPSVLPVMLRTSRAPSKAIHDTVPVPRPTAAGPVMVRPSHIFPRTAQVMARRERDGGPLPIATGAADDDDSNINHNVVAQVLPPDYGEVFPS
ncbi:hypothetical protein CVT24_010261 [Panaeolus cyanescens]|uniref:Uncharacterized protein n=1 Tax=Panaeolus cyanescens TaxID=181874 RepID=A0A409YPZ2_9AGAR|nr:hypothetical protein CVT24_010261 [Panaeolus cyanescens]